MIILFYIHIICLICNRIFSENVIHIILFDLNIKWRFRSNDFRRPTPRNVVGIPTKNKSPIFLVSTIYLLTRTDMRCCPNKIWAQCYTSLLNTYYIHDVHILFRVGDIIYRKSLNKLIFTNNRHFAYSVPVAILKS